jgi:molybdopterin adenylyltransferase
MAAPSGGLGGPVIAVGTRALVLTISDGVAHGTRDDESGRALGDRLAIVGFHVDRQTVPDDRQLIESALRSGAADRALVITTGGTGLTPRDVTPQASAAVVDYEVPGLAEAMRAAGRTSTPMADLSRGIVGVIGKTLVVNVPGSPRAALESLAALEPTLAHALETLAGPFEHSAEDAGTALRADRLPAPAHAPGTEAPATTLNAAAPGDPNDPWRDLGPGAVPDPGYDPGEESAP